MNPRLLGGKDRAPRASSFSPDGKKKRKKKKKKASGELPPKGPSSRRETAGNNGFLFGLAPRCMARGFIVASLWPDNQCVPRNIRLLETFGWRKVNTWVPTVPLQATRTSIKKVAQRPRGASVPKTRDLG